MSEAKTQEKKYPAPQGNPETQAFWDAAKQGKFMIKRCTACGEAHYFPRSICPFCFSDKTVWEESSGEGEIYTFSLMRKSPTGGRRFGRRSTTIWSSPVKPPSPTAGARVPPPSATAF